MTASIAPRPKALDPAKFRDPKVTAKGEQRAAVALLDRLDDIDTPEDYRRWRSKTR